MDNSMAAKPYSTLKGDPYRAYEELPVAVRRALQEALVDWCPLRAREWHLDLLRRQRLRPAQAAFLLIQTIRRQDHAEVAAFARTWPKGALAYPHLAAGATIQSYAGMGGIPEAETVPVIPPAKRSGPRAKSRAKPNVKLRAKPRAKTRAKRLGSSRRSRR